MKLLCSFKSGTITPAATTTATTNYNNLVIIIIIIITTNVIAQQPKGQLRGSAQEKQGGSIK